MTEQVFIISLFIGILAYFENCRIGREKIFVYNEDKNKAMLATFLIVFYSSLKKHRLYYVRLYGPLQAVFLYFITKKGKTENALKKENNFKKQTKERKILLGKRK